MQHTYTVVELFAGVGGFRLGLEGWHGKSATSGYAKDIRTSFKVVWSNQWEPSTKTQHASMLYTYRFGKAGHSNVDISTVPTDEIPDHDILVGGFPCQDYSVAATLKSSKGLNGKKGALWWSIHKILSEKKRKPKYLLLENVNRLLASPSKQNGRDFAIILKSLNDLGYAVEWRVINAADYGMPQRRKRVFILAYLQSTMVFRQIKKHSAKDWMTKKGTIAIAFPVNIDNGLPKQFHLEDDITTIAARFNSDKKSRMFENAGLMINGIVTTLNTAPKFRGDFTKLKDIIWNGEVAEDFYINKTELDRWSYLKGSKKEARINKDGFKYNYSEGKMAFPDSLDKPSRTIITGEGGPAPSRCKHVIKTVRGYRRLLPIELERLNMFPNGHTKLEGISDVKRAFFMGNALVVGVVEKIGNALYQMIG